MGQYRVKFSHNYPKLHNQKRARLVSIIPVDREKLSDKFIKYDTMYLESEGVFPLVEKYFPLPPGRYMVLVFVGEDLIPFSTVRPWNEQKFKYYTDLLGLIFDLHYPERNGTFSEY